MRTCRFWNQLDLKNVDDKYFNKKNLWKITPQNCTKMCANLQFARIRTFISKIRVQE